MTWEIEPRWGEADDGTEILCAIGSCTCPRTLYYEWAEGHEDRATCTAADPVCECYDEDCHCNARATVHLKEGDFCAECARGLYDDLYDFVICGKQSKGGTRCPDCGSEIRWSGNDGQCDCVFPGGGRMTWHQPSPEEQIGTLDAGKCSCCGNVVRVTDARRPLPLGGVEATDGPLCGSCMFFCYRRGDDNNPPERPDHCLLGETLERFEREKCPCCEFPMAMKQAVNARREHAVMSCDHEECRPLCDDCRLCCNHRGDFKNPPIKPDRCLWMAFNEQVGSLLESPKAKDLTRNVAFLKPDGRF